MDEKGVKVQTIKAQLIYMSYFEDVQNFNAESYANLFANAPNDSDLIAAINSTYSLDIDYDEFIRTYTFVMNSTINAFMFSDTSTKNCADLAAWADNAYISGWGYMNGFIGERSETDRIRYADNAGLVLGYLNYDPMERCLILLTAHWFIPNKVVLIPCRKSQAWDCSMAVNTGFISAIMK